MIGHDTAYSAMLTFLPHGVLGLMVSGLLAAYVSTISTHLNWGTSYLVHDLYRRFIRTDADERHYVMMGRIVTGLLMLLAAGMTFLLESARASFELLLSIGAGSGLLYLLRWYWWRINAWSEIAAMVVSFTVAVGFFVAGKLGIVFSPNTPLLVTVFATTFAWIGVTLPRRRRMRRHSSRSIAWCGPPDAGGARSQRKPASAHRPTVFLSSSSAGSSAAPSSTPPSSAPAARSMATPRRPRSSASSGSSVVRPPQNPALTLALIPGLRPQALPPWHRPLAPGTQAPGTESFCPFVRLSL